MNLPLKVAVLSIFLVIVGMYGTDGDVDVDITYEYVDRTADRLPSEDGVPYNEDQLNGATYENELLDEDELSQQRQNESTGGSHEHELEIQNIEAHYYEWWQEYLETGLMPEISDEVQGFLDENGITEENLQEEYVRKTQGASHWGRRKRSYLSSSTGVWTKCIVPFVYASSLSDKDKVGMDKVHDYYHKYTGFRFVPFNATTTKEQYGLDHNNFLRYVRTSGCWSFVGNLRGKGQNIAPCGGGGVAIHEIGHALGMMHEQKNPQSFPYIRIEYQNINPSYRSEYYRDDITSLADPHGFYDISSRMHYGRWGFNINYGKTMTSNDPDYDYLIGGSNDFYMFKELQEYHECYAEFPSCEVPRVCHNGGFVSVIEGSCQCFCPPYLDPETNCTTKLGTNEALRDMAWPDGKFTLLKSTEADCPEGFQNGTMVHWPVSNIWHSNPYRHSPKKQTYELGHDVCTKTDPESTGGESSTAVWRPGKYCTLRYGGQCAEGFEMGYQSTYGPVKRNDTNKGVLPDGEHGYLFEYIYCCRNDGSKDDPIQLPTKTPFILFLKDYWGCQAVEGMLSSSEYYNFISDRSETVNETGMLPYMYKFDSHRRNIHYCFYTPVNSDCGMLKVMQEGETTFTFTSPDYPNNYDNALECFWHISSPEGTRMQLDFNDFEVSGAEESSCKDHLEIGLVKPSIKGFKVCGHGYQKTSWTWDNFMSLKLVTKLGNTYKGFNATVTVFRDEDLCYNGDGSDGSYSGSVDYTKTFQPCIPWEKATKCLFGKFDSKVVDWKLSGNSCRNVGVGTQPWCYINADTCERQNCDVCMWGSCYDKFLDCESQIEKDPEYCNKNELGEAHHGCMKTCGFCEQRIKQEKSNCGPPPNVGDIVAEPQQDNYTVGDVVTYRCPTSNDYRTSTCTSDGSWEKVNFVCESCPNGFAVFEQRCFKWLGYEAKVDHLTAVAMCNASGSVLVKLDSPSVTSFVQSILEYDGYDKTEIWIGATADKNRVWSWDDGTQVSEGWTNWQKGQPNNWGGKQSCMRMRTDKAWDDLTCTSKLLVVCEYQFDKTGACDDQIPNCLDLLMENPDMCSEYSLYTTHNCKSTCGIGDCKSAEECEDSIQTDSHTTRVIGADQLVTGQYVQYECDSGYIKKSGDHIRVCTASGNLTGSSLVCEATDVCSDYLEDCGEILLQNPNLCEESPDFADRYCRSTCGVGVCGPNATCIDDSYSNFTTKIYGSDVLSVGQYVEYSCNVGTIKQSGSELRVCLSSGQLSGSELSCTSMFVCEDTLTTCEDILRETPEMCELHSDYGWKNCFSTCGFGDCQASTTCADDTDQGQAAVRLRGSDQIRVGDYLEYTCNEGFMKTGGDTKRACLPDGSLSGKPVVCSSIGDCQNDLPECESMLIENPKMCTEHEQFSWHNCRQTCGYGESNTLCIDDTSSNTMVTRIAGLDIMAPGQYIEYTCDDGFLRESGEYVRACLLSGNFTGEPLTCTRSSDVISCEDLHDDCEHRLEINPKLCIMYPDYAAHFCRKTCGEEECKLNRTCNAVPDNQNNVTKVKGSDQLNIGEYAVYECTTDLLKDSGNFMRACLPSGDMTGTEAVCSANHEDSSPSIVCEDQSDLCESDLERTPDMCSRYTDYSWHNCRRTCGVGECRTRSDCVDDTNLGYRATRITGGDTVTTGQIIEYVCNDGYFKGAGDEKRACLPSGQLTGSPLICLHRDVTTNVDLFTDKEIYKRRESSTSRRWSLANVTDMTITVSGSITSWTFFSNYGGTIAFGVWRFFNESLDQTAQLIGFNVIRDSPNERGFVYRVPESEQIYAEVGDVVGVYQYNSEISYTRCSQTYQPDNFGWMYSNSKKNDVTQYEVGVDYTFKTSSHNCRTYSIRASVNPSVCREGD